MLCSTTGSYGQLVIEAAYRETMIHSIEVVWEILAWEKWLGCHHDASLMFDIPESIPVWAPYIIFFDFHDIKTYMYYIFKPICIIKKNTGGF